MSKVIKIGNLRIGGGNPCRVQGMVKRNIKDREAIKEFEELKNCGAEIVRVAVKSIDEVDFLKRFTGRGIPIVADVHFDYRIAVESVKIGVDKIRLNPSNITEKWKVEEIVKMAKDKNIPIRVGANIGSLKNVPKEPEERAELLLKEVEKEIDIIQKYNFNNIVVSMKAEDIKTTYIANKIFSKKYDFPLHVGLTATGEPISGIIKSSILIGMLLNEGIGDTVRVSLTSSSTDEVKVAWEILFSLGIREPDYEIISCPGCGRTDIVEFFKIFNEVKRFFL